MASPPPSQPAVRAVATTNPFPRRSGMRSSAFAGRQAAFSGNRTNPPLEENTGPAQQAGGHALVDQGPVGAIRGIAPRPQAIDRVVPAQRNSGSISFR